MTGTNLRGKRGSVFEGAAFWKEGIITRKPQAQERINPFDDRIPKALGNRKPKDDSALARFRPNGAQQNQEKSKIGGGGGIRTHDRVPPMLS